MKDWSESDIQALKSQQAKDLAIEFLQQLHAKQQGPHLGMGLHV
ncbi:hypothetical protein [Adhaeretor mobilis]|nr:hypothetical protein [Adhaeretor mobilis]